MPHKMIYLDNASTTSVHPEVLSTYTSLLQEQYANSESLYDAGVHINQLMEQSRQAIAKMLNVQKEEVIFTCGASEANNMIIKGVAFSLMGKKKHCITTKIEHSSTLNAFKELEEVFGFEVTYLDVDKHGVILLDQLKKALRSDTALVSIMMVNNEVGSIMPIEQIKEIVKKNSHAVLHMDGVQALTKMDFDLKGIDCISFSAHKINGLKGSGIAVIKQHIDLVPLINGGQQEFHRRGGTSNALVNIVLAKTLRLSLENAKNSQIHCDQLKTYLIDQLESMDQIVLNSTKDSICHIVNFSCKVIPSEVMMNALNQKGYCVTAQSTCSSKSKEPSYVLKAMGVSDQLALSSIRVSFSKENTLAEVNEFCEALKEIIKKYGTKN